MKSPLQDYFDFSRREQVGLMSLVVIIVAGLVFLNAHDYFYPQAPEAITDKERALIASIETEREKQAEKYASQAHGPKKYPDKRSSRKALPAPFIFDPNTLDATGYQSLGFSIKQAESIRKYLDRGGQVRSLADFKKLYVVNDYMYDRLKDFIEIGPLPERNFEERSQTFAEDRAYEPKPKIIVDINQADTTELKKLSGIGSSTAKAIVKYRDIIQGYDSIAQLHEVFILQDRPETIEALRDQLVVGEFSPEQVNINTCEWVNLVRLPHIDANIARSILAMRETHGPYGAVEEILKSHLINQALYELISPSLTVEHK